MIKLQPVRGTQDLIGVEALRHRGVIETARRITSLYGATEWITPMFEATAVFSRTLGDTSDVVTKEMYSFEDRGGESITLRPEGTAGICRALVTNGLTQSLPQKVFYAGAMFRFERPQKGRYRQFHQIGLEILGADTAVADAEAIACGGHVLHALGIDRGVELNINTLGDSESRDAYRTALVNFFSVYADKLSADSKLRLQKNPLRILDSKDEDDLALVARAPTIHEYLTIQARDFYATLKARLVDLDVAFVENPRIVRGLDYYNHSAFEFVTTRLGAQGTILAGGRYDMLVELMGGPKVPGIGWAAGIERLSMLIDEPVRPRSPVAVIPMQDTLESLACSVLRDLRAVSIPAEMAYRGNAKRRLERANKSEAAFAILIGADEASRGAVALKNLADGTQREVQISDLPDVLQ